MKNIDRFLKELEEVEGNHLHRNKTEKNVTTAYGVYLEDRESTNIYKYISSLGNKLGFSKDPSHWNAEQIKEVDSTIDKDTQYKYIVEFYEDYFKSLAIEDLHPAIAVNICNLFVNSRKLGTTVLQKSTNEMIELLKKQNKYTSLLPNRVDEDGLIGSKTRASAKKLSSIINMKEALVWNSIGGVIACAEYVNLVEKNENKMIYLSGWVNRVLENMRDNIKIISL